MSTWMRDLLLLAVSVLGALGMVRYYIMGILDKDRLVSRGAVAGFILFALVAIVSLLGLLS